MVFALAANDENTWSTTRTADPEAEQSWLETLGHYAGAAATAPVDVFRQSEQAGRIFSSAERSMRLVDTTVAARSRLDDAYQGMADKVKAATGVTLVNPLRPSPEEAAQAAGNPALMDAVPVFDAAQAQQDREQAFMARVAQLKQQYPDKLAAIDTATPMAAQADANAVAAEKAGTAAWQNTPMNPVVKLGASLAGSLYGSREDPAFWASFALPVGGQGATAVGRVLNAAAVQALGQGAITALTQPVVQAGRAELGLEHGFAPAARNVGIGMLGGGLGGALFHGAGEAIGAARARFTGQPAAPRMATEAADAMGLHLSAEDHAALAGAHAADTADAALRPPEGIPPQEAQGALRDALVRATDPEAPLPLGSRPVPAGTTDALAMKIIDSAETPAAALEALRADPEAVRSALSSPHADVAAAGHVASLEDAAYGMVQQAGVPYDQAAIVARYTDDAARQAELMQAIIDARPADATAAREVMNRAIDADNARYLAEQAVQQDARAARARRRPQRDLQAESLMQFLARNGGLAPDRDLLHMLGGHNPFIPGYGRLIRKTGMDLDTAWRAAAVDNFLLDGRLTGDAEQWTTGINDLLQMVDAEARGQRQYRVGQEPKAGAIDKSRELHDMETALDSALASAGIDPATIDDTLRNATLANMQRLEMHDPLIAFERAVMAESEQLDAVQAGRIHETGPIEGWDSPLAPGRSAEFPADAGGASPAGRAPAAPDLAAGGEGAGGNAGAAPRDAGQGDGSAPGDLIDAVPVLRDDGSVAVLDRGALADVGTRDRFLSDVVDSCKA